MAGNGIDLATAYVSIVPTTRDFKAGVQKAVDDAGKSATKQFQKSGRQSGQSFGKSFGSQLSQSMPLSGFRSSLKQYEGAAAKSGALAGKALGVAFTAAATAGIAGLGYTLFKGFERYQALDAATNKLHNMNKTFAMLGKTGFDVQDTLDGVRNILEQTPFALEQGFSLAANAIASNVKDVNKYIEDVANAAAYAGTDLQQMGAIFNQVMVKGKLQGDELLQFFNAGLPISTWLKDLYGAQGDITKMISDGQIGIEHLQYAVEKFARGSAASMQDTLQGSIMQAKTAFARLGETILSSLFGSATQSGTTDLQQAINGITAQINKLTAWVSDHRDDIKAFFDGAVNAAQTLISAVQRVIGWLDKVGIGAGEVVTAFVAWKTIAGVSSLSTALVGIETALKTKLPAAAAAGAASINAALAGITVPLWLGYLIRQNQTWGNGDQVSGLPSPTEFDPRERTGAEMALGPWLGPMLDRMLGNEPPAGSGQFPSGAFGNAGNAGNIAMPPMPGRELQWVDGRGWVNPWEPDSSSGPLGPPPDLLPGTGSDGAGGSDSVPKPVVPFNTDLPAWAQGGPVTPSVFSAESSWLDTRHDLEEKRAFLNQLEQSNTATEAEIQDAKNAVIEADRDMHEQDMRLQDAKRSAYEDATKAGATAAEQFGGMADAFGSAVQLDQDLGISRGLVGLADNLLRFVANLAAAPLKGLLSGITGEMDAATARLTGGTPSSSAGGGGGLFGNLLPNMMFGGATSGGLGGYAGDAALLANVPAGQYTQANRGDLTQGLADCSSAVEDLVNIMDGRPTTGASMWTGNASQWLQSRGFIPGMGGPGTFRVGFNSGHMQATLPGGTNFNWGGADSAARGGVGGTGAYDPAFTDHYYRPVTPQQQQQQQPWNYPQWRPPGFSSGGGVDSVPAMLTPGEHVLTKDDVSAMGGQSGVYNFRNALHRNTGGPIPLTPIDEELLNSPENTDPGLNNPPTPGVGVAPAPFGAPSTTSTTPALPGSPNLNPTVPFGAPNMLGADGKPMTGPDGNLLGPDGKPIDPQDEALKRLAGFIPQAAKANTVSGTSNLSRIWMMGAEVVNGLIDQGASAASSAVGLAIAGGTMGAGAMGASQAGSAAASFAIGLGAEAAKRSVSYWAQMGGIATDALVEQLTPFGAPAWMGFDTAGGSGINALIDSRKKAKQGGVYDQGGILEPGGMAINMSQQPESVLTKQQWDLMAQTQPASPSYGVHIENVSVSDVDEMSRAISSRQRLAAMQYTGRPGL